MHGPITDGSKPAVQASRFLGHLVGLGAALLRPGCGRDVLLLRLGGSGICADATEVVSSHDPAGPNISTSMSFAPGISSDSLISPNVCWVMRSVIPMSARARMPMTISLKT